MDSIYCKLDVGIAPLLEELCQIYKDNHYIGITINLPRSKFYVKKTSKEQKNFVRLVFATAINKMEKIGIGHYKLIYEFCKDGVIHAHAMLRCDLANHKVGIVQDLSKQIIREAEIRMKRKLPIGTFHSEYIRYTSPTVLIQYMNTPEETLRWLLYMYKDQNVGQQVAHNKMDDVPDLMKYVKTCVISNPSMKEISRIIYET